MKIIIFSNFNAIFPIWLSTPPTFIRIAILINSQTHPIRLSILFSRIFGMHLSYISSVRHSQRQSSSRCTP